MLKGSTEGRYSKSLWSLIGFVSALCIVTITVTGIGVVSSQLTGALSFIATLLAVSWFYTRKRPDARIARLSRGMAELFILIFVIGLLSYNATSLNRPLWDEVFQSWDARLGFDWRYWLSVLNEYPNVHIVLATAYQSMLPQTLLAVIALTSIRAYGHLDTYLLAYGVAALITVVIAGAIPALSPLVHLAITPADHPNIVLAIPMEFQEQAQALREGRMRMVDLGGAQGLVTFPSFHTVSTVLLFLAFGVVPYVRWASLVLNSLMLISIPIEGSHYLVDVLAGAAVGLMAWRLAAWMIRNENAGPVRHAPRAIADPA